MTEPIAPWRLTVPSPAIVVRATCSVDEALGALAHALTAEGFRIRHSTVPLRLKATRTNWWYLLTGWPEKDTVVADAVPTSDGCTLRVHHPSGNADLSARVRAVRTLERTVTSLRACGARVVVGEWEPGPPRRRRRP